MIETSQLQTLVAVAQSQSFSRAAEQLGVTQSAISQSIKNLESKLKTPLFKRSGKKVVLTQEGEKLFEMAEHFLSSMEETLEQIKYAPEQMQGKIRIGTLNGVGKSWLAPEIFQFAKHYPDLKIFIKMGLQKDLVAEFEELKLDILILPTEYLPNVGKKVFLSDERSTLVFPKNHPAFKISKDITPLELQKFPTIMFEKNDHLYYTWFKTKFQIYPKNINIRYSINSHGHILHAVRDGMGVAVVPTHVLNRSILKNDVDTLGTDFEVVNYRMYMAYHKESEHLLRIQRVLEHLLKRPSPLI